MKPLFIDENTYRLDEIVAVVKYDSDYVRKVIKCARVPATRIVPGKRNSLRFSGKDLNNVFKQETVTYM